MIVRGDILSNGTPSQGEGYTSSQTGTGTYQINFAAAFLDAPACTITCQGPGAVACMTILNSTTVTLTTYPIGGGVPINSSFSFIAIGQRSS
jgi:hypothetical protein